MPFQNRYAYFHIPKAAGTSFTNALAAVGTVAPAHFANDRISKVLAADMSRYDIVAGHLSGDDYISHFSKRLALTVLRHPVDRCLSWYWYCRNVVPATIEAPEVVSAKHLPPVEYFSQPRSTIFRIGMNGQCRQLGGHLNHLEPDDDQLFRRAKELLDAMVWIGLTETLQRDLERLRLVRDFKNLISLKITNTASRDYEVDPAVRRIIETNNQADIELYNLANAIRSRPKKTWFLPSWFCGVR
jgi:hypothetical protein